MYNTDGQVLLEVIKLPGLHLITQLRNVYDS